MFKLANQNTLFFHGKQYLFSMEHEKKLIELAESDLSGTSRICLHEFQSCSTQNMIICILPNRSFAPHSHPASKSESYTVLRGRLYVDTISVNAKVLSTFCLTRENTPYMHRGLVPHRSYTLDSYCIFQEIYHGSFVKEFDIRPLDFKP